MNQPYYVPVAAEDRSRVGLAVQLVSVATGVPGERMRAHRRLTGAECRARKMAMYLASVAFGWPLERVAHAFGMSRASAAAACRWVEDQRERPPVDALMDQLEHCIGEAIKAPVFEVRA